MKTRFRIGICKQSHRRSHVPSVCGKRNVCAYVDHRPVAPWRGRHSGEGDGGQRRTNQQQEGCGSLPYGAGISHLEQHHHVAGWRRAGKKAPDCINTQTRTANCLAGKCSSTSMHAAVPNLAALRRPPCMAIMHGSQQAARRRRAANQLQIRRFSAVIFL